MTREFADRPVDPALLADLVDLATRAPSAGKTQGWHLIVLSGAETSRFWDATMAPERRSGFRWQGLLTAPVIAIPLADPAAYVERYAEPDKARSGLGDSPDAWPTPYWTVDASMSVMTLLLAAEDAGLGALLFGVFNGEDALRTALQIPDRLQLLGAIALGWPRTRAVDGAGEGAEDSGADGPGNSAGHEAGDRAGGAGLSAGRRRRQPAEVIHHGGW